MEDIEMMDLLPEGFEDESVLPPGVVPYPTYATRGMRDRYLFVDERVEEPEAEDMRGDALIEDMFDMCARAARFAADELHGPLVMFVNVDEWGIDVEDARASGFLKDADMLNPAILLTPPPMRARGYRWRYLKREALDSPRAFIHAINEAVARYEESGDIYIYDPTIAIVINRCIYFRPVVAPTHPHGHFGHKRDKIVIKLEDDEQYERCTTHALKQLIYRTVEGKDAIIGDWDEEHIAPFVEKYANPRKSKKQEPIFTYDNFRALLNEFKGLSYLEIPYELEIALPAEDKTLRHTDITNLRFADTTPIEGARYTMNAPTRVYLSTTHVGLCALNGGCVECVDAKLTTAGVIFIKNATIPTFTGEVEDMSHVREMGAYRTAGKPRKGGKKKVMTLTHDVRVDTKQSREYRQVVAKFVGERKDRETLLCGFDFETVADMTKGSFLHVYSVAYMFCKMPALDETMAAMNEAHARGEAHPNDAKVIVAADALAQFVDIIIEAAKGHRIIFVSFNGSSFDNVLLMNELLKSETGEVNSLLYTPAGLLGASMMGNDSNFFDLRRHLVGSLAYNCAAFGVRDCKTSIDHTEYQRMMNDTQAWGCSVDNRANPFYEWARTHNPNADGVGEIYGYNARDVECMMNLLVAYRAQLMKIPEIAAVMPNGDIFQYKTIPSLVKAAWKASFTVSAEVAARNPAAYRTITRTDPATGEKTEVGARLFLGHMSDDMLPEYTALCANRTGGRCDLFNGPYNHDEETVSADVCSLYPYVMGFADVSYPCGEISKIAYKDRDPALIGFYPCRVDQATMAEALPPILPLKTEAGNDWRYEVARSREAAAAQRFLSTVEIAFLRHHGATVSIDEEAIGLQWAATIKGFDLFPIIPAVMKIKQREDERKAAKQPCNNALRNAAKLVMNSLSGKPNEGVHLDKTELITKIARYAEVLGRYPHHSVVEELDSGYLIVQYKKEMLELFGKHQNAVAIGSMIYTFARAHMFEHVFSKIDRRLLDYTDTDSAHMMRAVFDKWVATYASKVAVPHDPRVEDPAIGDARYSPSSRGGAHPLYLEGSKVPGAFENEYDEFRPAKPCGETGLAKKVYTTRFIDAKGVVSTKKRGLKGANPARDIYVPADEVARVKEMSGEELFEYYTRNSATSTIAQRFDEIIHALTACEPHGARRVDGSLVSCACPACARGVCPIAVDPDEGVAMLCFSMQKIYKNHRSCDVHLGEKDKYEHTNRIRAQYTIKHLKLQQV